MRVTNKTLLSFFQYVPKRAALLSLLVLCVFVPMSAFASTPSTSYSLQDQVRIKGTTTWSSRVTAKEGDTVQYMVTYSNTGSTTQTNVILKDTVPNTVSYQSGTSMLKNGTYPTGKAVSDNIVASSGINISDYSPGGTAYVIFDATLPTTIPCGSDYLTNVIKATSGSDSRSASSVIVINKTCAPTPTAPTHPTAPTLSTSSAATTTTTTTQTTTPAPAQSTSSTTTQSTTSTESPAASSIPDNATTPAAASPTPAPASTPAPLPSTGPTEVIGSLIGSSSLGLGIHHYLASRRALKQATQL